MDKFLYGKLLGEIYRIEKRGGFSPVSEGRIYGLINGIETAIDEEIKSNEILSNEQLQKIVDILSIYWKDPKKLEMITGYYDIEPNFENAGLDRGQLIKALTYFKANRRFEEIIDKFDSQNSPGECRTFELDDYEK